MCSISLGSLWSQWAFLLSLLQWKYWSSRIWRKSWQQFSKFFWWIQLGIRHNIIILESFLHYQFRNVKVEFNPKMSLGGLGQFNKGLSVFSFMTENVYRKSSTIISYFKINPKLLNVGSQKWWNHWNHQSHIQESKNLKKVAWAFKKELPICLLFKTKHRFYNFTNFKLSKMKSFKQKIKDWI